MAETATAAPVPSRKDYLQGPSLLAWVICFLTWLIVPIGAVYFHGRGVQNYSTVSAVGVILLFLALLSLLRGELRYRTGQPADLGLMPRATDSLIPVFVVSLLALGFTVLGQRVTGEVSFLVDDSVASVLPLLRLAAVLAPALLLVFLGAPALLAWLLCRPYKQTLAAITTDHLPRLLGLSVLVWALSCGYFGLMLRDWMDLLGVFVLSPALAWLTWLALKWLAALLASLTEVPKSPEAGEATPTANPPAP